MLKRTVAAALMLFLLLTAGGCDSITPGPPEDPNFPVVVRGEDIPAAPQAIVSLSPGTTEMLFAMGYGGKVVGVGAYDDYPGDEVGRRHRCGTVLSPDLDTILSLSPDLVVAAAPLIETDLKRFQQQEIPVLVLPRAATLAELSENYLALATAVLGSTDGAAAGGEFWAALEGKLDEAAALSQGQEPITAILLRELDYAMATGDTFEQLLFDRVGLVNDAKRFANWRYDAEEVAALEPQVIFYDKALSADSIKGSSVYKPVGAVQNGLLMGVDLAAFERQSPRMFDILLEMARYAYGE